MLGVIILAISIWVAYFTIDKWWPKKKHHGEKEAMERKIENRDRPFILALVSSGITTLSILIASVGAWMGNLLATDTGMDILKFTFPLTTIAWAFYFSRRNGDGSK